MIKLVASVPITCITAVTIACGVVEILTPVDATICWLNGTVLMLTNAPGVVLLVSAATFATIPCAIPVRTALPTDSAKVLLAYPSPAAQKRPPSVADWKNIQPTSVSANASF